jgi:hypothetical protein
MGSFYHGFKIGRAWRDSLGAADDELQGYGIPCPCDGRFYFHVLINGLLISPANKPLYGRDRLG